MKKSPVYTSCRLILSLLFVCTLASAAQAAMTMDNVHVTDVTPSSFSIIWQTSTSTTTSEPASPDIKIYGDAAGTLDLTDHFELTPFPLTAGDPAITSEYNQDQHKMAFRTMLQNRGMMKIRVEGLTPGTTYSFKAFSVGQTETVAWPETGLSQVTTPLETGFVAENRDLIITVNQPDPAGYLVMAENGDTQYGVSAYVGDGAAVNKAVLNLANLFTLGGSNWQPPAGEQDVVITVLGSDAFSFTQTIAVTFTGNFIVAAVSPHLVGFDSQAALAMQEPERKLYSQDEPILLSWDDTALQVNASVSLYYDTDAGGEDGTLIVSGLAEDPDGAGDTYSWDTTGVADGTYFVYGVLSDGMVTVSSYAAGKIAIDRAATDSDGDLIADLWENLYFDTLDRTGADDLDSDGLSDGNEFADRTDPTVPDVRLRLTAGMNLVSIPLTMDPALHASELLSALAPNLLSVSRIDPTSQIVQMISYNGGTPQGDDFLFVPGAGYTFTMAVNGDQFLIGNTATDSIDLEVGSNLVGFVAPSTGYTAYQLLQTIGDATVVASVQRFNRATGLFETVGYHGTTPVGTDFPILRGEGYIITMRQDVTGFVLP